MGWSMRVRGLGGRKRAERLVRRWRGWRSGRTRLGPAMPTSELLRERVLARLNTWRCARLCRKFRLWSCTRCMVMRRWSFVACVATISLGTGLVAGLPSLALAQSGWFAGNLYVSPSSACFEYARNRPGECSCRSGREVGGLLATVWTSCEFLAPGQVFESHRHELLYCGYALSGTFASYGEAISECTPMGRYPVPGTGNIVCPPGNVIDSNGECACGEGQADLGGGCVPCPAGTTVTSDGTSCSCDNGGVENPGATDGNYCPCASGEMEIGGVCQVPVLSRVLFRRWH